MRRDHDPRSYAADAMDENIRDLADFCLRWRTLRGDLVEEALDHPGLSQRTRMTLGWLVSLTDAVCQDVGSTDGPLADPRDRVRG